MKNTTLILVLLLFGFRVSAQEPSLVFRDVTVIDGTGAAGTPSMTVVVSGARISDIGRTGDVRIPEDSVVIDGAGKFLIPGLWDMHVHLSKSGQNTLPLFVANGVTSVRDMGGDIDLLKRWKQEILEGKRVGPRIKMAGPMFESIENIDRMKREAGVEPVERFRVGLATPEEAEAVVGRLSKQGVDFLKVRSVSSVEIFRALGAAAKRHNLALVGHAVASPEELLQVGQRSIEHGFYPPLDDRSAEKRRELFRQFRMKEIAVVPTLVVGEALRVPYARMKSIVEDHDGKLEPKRKFLSGYLIEDWKEQVEEQKSPWPGLDDFLVKRARDIREMLESGVRIMPGTDTAVVLIWPGFSLHDELRLLVQQVGMTPMQALVSATRSPAEFFGMQESLGTVQKGKIADLVLLDGDPIEDINNTSKVVSVVHGGKLLSTMDRQRLLHDLEHDPGSYQR